MKRSIAVEIYQNIGNVYKLYAQGYRYRLLVIAVLSLASILFGVISPTLYAKIIESLTGSYDFNRFLGILALCFVCYLAWAILRFVIAENINVVSNGVSVKIRSELVPTLFHLRNSEFSSSGTYLDRMNSADSISNIFCRVIYSLLRILTESLVITVIFYMSWQVGVFAVIQVAGITLSQIKKAHYVSEKDKLFKKSKDSLLTFFGETVRGIREFKLLAVHRICHTFKDLVRVTGDHFVSKNKTKNIYDLITGLLADSVWIFSVILIGSLCYSRQIPIAIAVVLVCYLDHIGSIGFEVMDLSDNLEEFNISLNRLLALSDESAFPKEHFGSLEIDLPCNQISFKHVNFSYEGEGTKDLVLKDFSCELKRGEINAFIGPSGIGKSTLFSLLCKFYEIQAGSIQIDGYSIDELSKKTLRDSIALISQSPVFFNLSILDNFKYAKDKVEFWEIEKACKAVGLDTFIKSLTDGYNTVIGEGGINFSGGQIQRLAIARVLVRGSKILLFDEATSALDSSSQREVKAVIDSLKDSHIIIVIAHRLSAIKDCDNIIMLADGRVIEQGSYRQLRDRSEAFKNFYLEEID